MTRDRKQTDLPFEIRLDVQYAQPKVDPFGLGGFNEFGSRKVEYEQLPGYHEYHREFLALSGTLENAAREHGADWSIERMLKETESTWDPYEASTAAYDGGYADLLYQAAVLTSTAGLALKILKTIQPIIVQWLKNRSAISLHVKVGTSEVSVRGQHDLDEILKLLDNAKSGPAKKHVERSTKKQTSKKRPTSGKKGTSKKQAPSRKTVALGKAKSG